MNKAEAFIFDMDGVIIDSEPLHDKIVRSILAKDNIFVDDEEFKTYMGMASTEVFDIFIKKYNLPYTGKEMMDVQMSTLKQYIVDNHLKPIAGIVPLLKELKRYNIPVAIASSSPRHMIEFVADTFGITDYFKFFVSGEELTHSKPAPDIYLKTAEKFAVAPQNCIVLEDSRNGTVAAKEAGMYCIAFANPNSGAQDLSRADMIVKHISDIDLSQYFSDK